MFLRGGGVDARRGELIAVAPEVFAFRDTVNVYVIRVGEEAVLIDCGSGAVLDALGAVGIRKVAWVLLTHHHRENVQGAMRMRAQGARLAAPAAERLLIDGVQAFWRNPSGWSCEGAPYARPLRSPVRVDRSFRPGFRGLGARPRMESKRCSSRDAPACRPGRSKPCAGRGR